MAKSVVINGTTYVLPSQSDEQPWGSDLSDLIEALVDVANATSGEGDILTTTFSIANNVSSPTAVTGLQFDISTILSSEISYTIHRVSDVDDLTERGVISLTYNPTENEFNLAQKYSGVNAGVTFSISGAGQFLYTSSNLSSTNYEGTLTFSAKSVLQ